MTIQENGNLARLAKRAKKMDFKKWAYSNIAYGDVFEIKKKYGSMKEFYDKATSLLPFQCEYTEVREDINKINKQVEGA